ncbi:PTS fructose transporter subunit IIC [Streptomyces sp. NBC_00258]|uniref:PTS fructose transporter subunit IIC n=1 Tax=Streptomyces sp. NBC_00258 TaxID=2903642 RepID=UPI002E28015A|nr:PTS fructose transporter subunit IIC [Streptomyces sp. NBC_00258]
MSHPHNRTTAPATPMNRSDSRSRHIGIRLSRWLVSGTPYIGAFTALSALLVVLALAISGPRIAESASQALYTGDWSQPLTWAALLLKVGLSGLAFLPALVAAYVAYGMADRPAVVPGFLGGMAAVGIEGGALAGLVAGLVAGAATLALQRMSVPPALRGITSTVLFPLLATVTTSLVIFALIGAQLTSMTEWLHGQLAGLQFESAPLLGLILGLMVCSDLGGVISKAAVAFAMVGVNGPDPSKFNTLNMTIMATVVAAGMVPPLGLALAALVRRKLFTEAERDYAKTSWLFGAAFIPEGSVPFALADPLRVIPASMAGGAVTGALAMTFGTTLSLPYGGVFAAGQFGRPLLLAAVIAAGVLTTASLTIALKSLHRTSPAKTITPAVPRRDRGKTSVAG